MLFFFENLQFIDKLVCNFQVYFMNQNENRRNRRSRSSPVYSLSFDSEFLFTATDQNLNVFNFSIYDGPFKNYSDNNLFYNSYSFEL